MLRIIASIGLVQTAVLAINVIRSKIFAVLLGPAGFGMVATIDQLVVSVVQISNLSLPFTALKFLSHSHSRGEVHFRQLYSFFLKAITLLAVVAMFVAVVTIPANLDRFDSQLAALREPVSIALWGIPATVILIYLVNVLAARQASVQSVLLTALSGAVILAAGAIGYLLDGINGIYLATVLASTGLALAVIVFFRYKMKLPVWSTPSGVLAELFADSRIIEITIWVYFAVASASIQLLLARYAAITHVDAEAAGLLQACLAVSFSIGAVLGPANALYFAPYVNRNIPASEKIEAADRFLPILVLLYCLVGLMVLLFPKTILTILFSKHFATAAAILPWFVAWQCLYQISNVYQQLLIGLDDTRGYAAVTVGGNLVAAALCILLVGRYQLHGIAVGFVVGTLITALLTVSRLQSKHNLAVPKSAFALVVFAIIGFSAVAAIEQLTPEFSLIGLSTRFLTGGIFLASLWLILPASLRSEIRAGIAAKLRTWTR